MSSEVSSGRSEESVSEMIRPPNELGLGGRHVEIRPSRVYPGEYDLVTWRRRWVGRKNSPDGLGWLGESWSYTIEELADLRGFLDRALQELGVAGRK